MSRNIPNTRQAVGSTLRRRARRRRLGNTNSYFPGRRHCTREERVTGTMPRNWGQHRLRGRCRSCCQKWKRSQCLFSKAPIGTKRLSRFDRMVAVRRPRSLRRMLRRSTSLDLKSQATRWRGCRWRQRRPTRMTSGAYRQRRSSLLLECNRWSLRRGRGLRAPVGYHRSHQCIQ